MTTTQIMAAVALIVGSGLALHVMPAAQLEGSNATSTRGTISPGPGREVVQARIKLDTFVQ